MKPAVWIATMALLLPLTTNAAAPDAQSLEALRAQAERGNVNAQLDMGILYEYGFNFPDNKAPALAWYTLAAQQGSELAAKRRDTIKGKMLPAEIAEADRLTQTLAAKASSSAPAAPTPTPAAGEPAATPPPAPAVESAPAPAADATPPVAAPAEPAK